MIIRPATASDLPQILDIHNDAVRRLDAIWTEIEDSLADRAAWLKDREQRNFPVLVAIDPVDETLLGYASYGTYRAKSGYDLTIEHSIYLRDAAQGKGTGKALMSALIEDAKSKGYHLMVGVIDAKNQASIRFHEGFGFTHAGFLPQAGFKHGRWLDQVNMILLLNDNPPPPDRRA